MTQMPSAPPQYSPDGKFWWDGAQWQPIQSSAMHPHREAPWLLFGGAGAAIVGGFLPWATLLGISASGSSGDGLIAAGLALLASICGLLTVSNKPGRIGTIVFGFLIVAVAGYDIVNISSTGITVGYGLVITLIGGILVVVGGFRCKRQAA